ncbi:hypothetical protein PCANB_001840 [Pneumocystis canis]|nr:hypothetical protein PCANB_001840 [Pneumocystis canis]
MSFLFQNLANIGKDKHKKKGFTSPRKKAQGFSRKNSEANVKSNESLPGVLFPSKFKQSLIAHRKESCSIGIQNLSLFVMDKMDMCGKLFNFPSNILQKMRNLEVFRFEHRVDFSKDPVVVLRECSVYIGQKLLDDNVSSKNRRIVLIGKQGTGLDIVNNTTSFFYHEKTNLWRQPEYTSFLLEKFSKANFDILSKIFLSKAYHVGNHNISKSTPLSSFLEIGVIDSLISHDILEIFLKELSFGNGPPVLFTFDNISAACSPSLYMTNEYKTVHPYDLALIRTFFTYLNGKLFFERGAIIACASKLFNKPDRILEISLGFLKPKSYENVDERIVWAVNGAEYHTIENYTSIESENIIKYYLMANVVGRNIDNSILNEFIKEKILLSGSNPRELFWNCLRMI